MSERRDGADGRQIRSGRSFRDGFTGGAAFRFACMTRNRCVIPRFAIPCNFSASVARGGFSGRRRDLSRVKPRSCGRGPAIVRRGRDARKFSNNEPRRSDETAR